MPAHLSLPVSRSRPPIAKASQAPCEIAAMDVAFALAIALEAYALDAIVVLDGERNVIASAGRTASARTLAGFAAGMSEGEPLGAARSFDEGRVHLEVIALAGSPCVVAVRGQVSLDDPAAITDALRASFALETSSSANDHERDAAGGDDFEFDLAWAESPSV